MSTSLAPVSTSTRSQPEFDPAPRMAVAGIAALGFLAVLIGSGALPVGIEDLSRVLLAAALFAGATIRVLLSKDWRPALLLPVGLAMIAFDALAGGLAIGLAWWIWFGRHWNGAVMLAGLGLFGWLRSVTTWPDVFGGWLTAAIAKLLGLGELQIGVTAAGYWPLLFAACLVLPAAFRSEPNPRRLARTLAIIALVSVTLFHFLRVASAIEFVEEQPTAAGLFTPLWTTTAVLAGLIAWYSRPPAELDRVRWTGPRLIAGALAALCFAPLALWFLPAASPKPAHVAFLNEGGLDWHRPERGTPMGIEFGMFGDTPYFFEQDGMKTSVIDAGPSLEAQQLADVDILVTINNPRSWDSNGLEAVDQFLEAGGSLLVLGDHTDVFGCKKGFDSLLQRYGISFRFDSAYHARASWSGCAIPTHHPGLTLGEDRPLVIGHGIGASLEIDAGVEPLITGRFAFGDLGVRENTRGAFLGNYRFDASEIVGDLTLAAWRSVGRGRVVAYGDTSAYQSGGIRHAYRSHVLPVMRWLATPSSIAENRIYRLFLAGITLAGLALAMFRRGSEWIAFTALAAVTCVAIPAVVQKFDPIAAQLSDKVLIDESLAPLTGHHDVSMNETSPVYTNLARCGLLPVGGNNLERDLRRQPRGVVILAPTRPLRSREASNMLEYMQAGGQVLIAAGLESRPAVRPLLEQLGIDIGRVPLGVVPPSGLSGPERLEPRTREGWPILVAPDSEALTENLFVHGPHRLAVYRTVGMGGLVLISDSRFFSSANVESLWSVWPGNVRFLDHLFQRMFEADSSEVAERFESPEKPE